MLFMVRFFRHELCPSASAPSRGVRQLVGRGDAQTRKIRTIAFAIAHRKMLYPPVPVNRFARYQASRNTGDVSEIS